MAERTKAMMAGQKMKTVQQEALYSTVLIRSNGSGHELLAFTQSIGAPMNGSGDEHLVSTIADTNMRCSNTLCGSSEMTVRAIRFSIPRTVEPRFLSPLPCRRLEPYTVQQSDIEQILNRGVLAYYFGGDKPRLRCRLVDGVPKGTVADAAFVGELVVSDPEEWTIHGGIEKFWVELSWPDRSPVFGPLCVLEPNCARASIPITIYLVP